ncbi:MAG: 16S rRNA (cytosine(967)-C(5))-methyltransferase RsmB [Ruminococcus sp.]|nr:16S rRNA (cytosine(967)-C(5))-methyltransferase RsmB [Ruminococcus sp.]
MHGARYTAVKLLDKTFSGGSYSNIQLGSALAQSDMEPRDKRLCTAIYYGVIERKLTLDHIIGGLCSRPLKKLDSIVLNALRAGLYQIYFMDSVPDSAAVNESVALVKQLKKGSASGLVNAVLRSAIRSGKALELPEDWLAAAEVKYSAPAELIESLAADYGREAAEDFLAAALENKHTYLRRNPLRCTEDEFLAAMGDIPVTQLFADCYVCDGGDLTATEAFQRGFFHVQDLSSQMCCMALAPTETDTVLDICAAPGGKTFTMAELMGGRGQVSAFDLHEKRVKLIRDGADRLGLANIQAKAGDASRFDPALPKFTKILCDVPCSGLGVIAHKPEIKYKDMADFAGLPEIQYNIAANALNYLAPGGELVYSTCTLRRAENDAVVERLLTEHDFLEPAELPTLNGRSFGTKAALFPQDGFGDGFFIAKFRRAK